MEDKDFNETKVKEGEREGERKAYCKKFIQDPESEPKLP
jgi:hypothetical protein